MGLLEARAPQQTGTPLVLTAQVPCVVDWMLVTVPRPTGIVVWPLALSPQQNGVPSVLITQVSKAPSATELVLIAEIVPMPAGMSTSRYQPQQYGVLSGRTTH